MHFQRSGNKYRAKSSVYNGYYYASKLEASYAAELDLRQRAGEILRWERQVPVDLVVNGIKVCRYIVDFRVFKPNGEIVWVETKGFVTDTARIKMRLFEAAYLHGKEGETYEVVKQH
jgi:hypothetical protein